MKLYNVDFTVNNENMDWITNNVNCEVYHLLGYDAV
jgi:hypothetical protein